MFQVQVLFYKALRAPETITGDVTAAYYKALDFLQDQLKSRGTQFLAGSEPGYVDYMIWPFFERILLIDFESMTIDSEKYKLLVSCHACDNVIRFFSLLYFIKAILNKT